MAGIIIRSYQKEDQVAVQDITYRTGFKGEDLTGRRYFDDSGLWFLIFIFYYTRYEPEHCFVAVDTSNSAVVGFICGTPDTVAQEEGFLKKVVPRIALRVFLFTLWRYPGTFKTLVGMAKLRGDLNEKETVSAIQSEYPAHLHINLLPEYQRIGLGTRLVKRFEAHMIRQNVKGIHLQTTNHNHKAVPFYEKLGYAIVHETAVRSQPTFNDLSLLTFAKKLGP